MSTVMYRLEHRNLKHRHSDCGNVNASPYIIITVVSSELYRKKYLDLAQILHKKHNKSDEFGEPIRPNPYDDGLDGVFNDAYVCGCPTIDTLNEWFNGQVNKWVKLGFVIRKYTLKNRFIGDSGLQCVCNNNDVISRKIVSD